MPPILREIEQAAIGCWMLVRGNIAGIQRFDLSVDGFWRSFGWAFPLAVFDGFDELLTQYINAQNGNGSDAPTSAILVWVIGAITSLLAFFLFPLIAGALARPMGLSQRYPTYIIARNWLTVFLTLPAYLIHILVALDVTALGLAGLPTLILIAVSIFAGTIVARLLLGTSTALAFGFSLLDFLQALLIVEVTSRLIS